MIIPKPQVEHLWLHQLVGAWNIDSECAMGPDQPPMKSTWRENVRPMGKLWTIGEAPLMRQMADYVIRL